LSIGFVYKKRQKKYAEMYKIIWLYSKNMELSFSLNVIEKINLPTLYQKIKKPFTFYQIKG